MRIFAKSVCIMLIVALMIVLSACSMDQFVKRNPIPSQCNAICYTPCVDDKGGTGIQWVGDYTDPNTWDNLGADTTTQLGDALRVCETRRKACVQCLNRLEEQKVIVQ